jgi:hypothetical protein
MVLVLVFGVALLIAVLLSGLAARTVLSTSFLFLVGGALVSDGFLVLIHITPDSEIVSVTAGLALFAMLTAPPTCRSPGSSTSRTSPVCPYVSTDDTATDAALLPAEHKLPVRLVLDRDDQPYAVVPGSQLVGRLVPGYTPGVPLLAAVIDDRDRGEAPEGPIGLTVSLEVPLLERSRELGGGCRAAGSGRRRPTRMPGSCTSKLLWRTRTPR